MAANKNLLLKALFAFVFKGLFIKLKCAVKIIVFKTTSMILQMNKNE